MHCLLLRSSTECVDPQHLLHILLFLGLLSLIFSCPSMHCPVWRSSTECVGPKHLLHILLFPGLSSLIPSCQSMHCPVWRSFTECVGPPKYNWLSSICLQQTRWVGTVSRPVTTNISCKLYSMCSLKHTKKPLCLCYNFSLQRSHTLQISFNTLCINATTYQRPQATQISLNTYCINKALTEAKGQ